MAHAVRRSQGAVTVIEGTMNGRDHRAKAIVVPASAPNAYGTIRSLAARGVSVMALDHQPSPIRHSRLCCFRVVPDPNTREPEFIEALLDAAGGREPPVVFATQDLHATVIQRHRATLESAIRFPFMPFDRFLDCIDKRRMAERAARVGLEIPETHWPETPAELDVLLPRLASYPYIIKPVAKFDCRPGMPSRNMAFFAAYGTKALRAATPAELKLLFDDAHGRGFVVLVQEEVEGPTDRLFAIDFYSDRQGRIVAHHTGHKIRQFPADFGTCTLGRSVPVDEILPLCRRFVESVGFWGIGNMEFKERDGSQIMMEMNPRPWMWIQLATAVGVNLPHLAYLDLCGKPGPRFDPARATADWIDLRVDLRHLGRGRGTPPREVLSLMMWLKSLAAVRVEARSTRVDPVPVVDAVLSALWRRMSLPSKG